MEQSKRSLWLGIITVALFAFAGYRIFLGASSKLDLPDTYTGYGVCLACGQELIVIYKKGDHEPFGCDACGEKAVCLWWFCDDCRHRFIPQLVRKTGKPLRPTAFPVCTYCNCTSVAGWNPENPDMAPEADAELPAWP